MKSFYECGSILLQEHQNEIREISSDMSRTKKPAESVPSEEQPASSATLTGYLFKRTHHNTFKKWTRRWFTLSGARLLYQKRWELGGVAAAPMESDLRLCKVREVHEGDRRFVFEIVSPRSRHLLQADSQPECAMWVQAIGKAIGEALNNIGKG